MIYNPETGYYEFEPTEQPQINEWNPNNASQMAYPERLPAQLPVAYPDPVAPAPTPSFNQILGQLMPNINKGFDRWEAQPTDFWDWASSPFRGDFEETWRGVEGAAGTALDVISAPFQWVGEQVGNLAESNIWGLDPLAEGLRFGWEQGLEPILNATPALIGTIGGTIENGWGFANQQWEQNDPEQAYQRTYQQAILSGKTPEQANLLADTQRRKLQNPINRMFQAGNEEFSTYSPVFQLGTMLADPIGNPVGNLALGGKVGTRIGAKTADGAVNLNPFNFDVTPTQVTNPIAPLNLAGNALSAGGRALGIDRLAQGVTRALESPQQRDYLANKLIDEEVIPTANSIADQTGLTVNEALSEIFNNPDSPYYYQTLGIGATAKPDILEKVVQYSKEAIEYPARAVENQYLNRAKENISATLLPPELQNRLNEVGDKNLVARLEQDARTSNNPEDFDRYLAAELYKTQGNSPDAVARFIREVWDDPQARADFLAKDPYFAETLSDNRQNTTQFNNTFNTSNVPLPKADDPLTPRPEFMNYVDFNPNKYAPIQDIYQPVRQALSLDFKASKVDTTGLAENKKPVIVKNKQLEQWGLIGAGLNVLNVPVSYLSRTALNTVSRAIRDPMSNVVKTKLGGYRVITDKVTTERFTNVFGEYNRVAKGGLSRDLPVPKEGRIAKTIYTLVNLPNEALAYAVSKVGGKLAKTPLSKEYFKDFSFNKLTDETLQGAIEKSVYTQVAMRNYDNAIAKEIQAIGVNQQIYDRFEVAYGKPMTNADLSAMVSGKMPQEKIVQSLTAEYRINPFTPRIYEIASKLDNTQFSNLMSLFDDKALQARLDLFNQAAEKSHKSSKLKSPYRPVTLDDLTPQHPVVENLIKDAEAFIDKIEQNLRLAEQAQISPIQTALLNQYFSDLSNNKFRKKAYDILHRYLEKNITQRNKRRQVVDDVFTKMEKQKQLDEIYAQYGKPTRSAIEKYKKEGISGQYEIAQRWKRGREIEKGLIDPASVPTARSQGSLTDAEKIKELYDLYFTGGSNKVKVGSSRYGSGSIQSIPSLKELYNKFEKVTAAQRATYLQDMLSTDQWIRDTSGNRYGLDPQTLEPINLDSKVHLSTEYNSQPVAPLSPDFKPLLDIKFNGDLVTYIKNLEIFDENGDPIALNKRWDELDLPARDLITSRVAMDILEVDPFRLNQIDLQVQAQSKSARELIATLQSDIAERFSTYSNSVKITLQEKSQIAQEVQNLEREMVGIRERAKITALQEADTTISKTFFDYNNKNLIDQALNSLVPFNFWLRQNFSYIARHFSNHPMHYAAVLNFYKEVEEQNSDLPDYAKGNIRLWTNPDGSVVLWNFNSVLPLNPLGDSESILKVTTDPNEINKTVNKVDLGVLLFGQDKAGGNREKGIIPTFFRPNPVIDAVLKTGKINEGLKAMGLVKDGFGGSGDPNKQTLSIIPSRGFIRDVGAATGITQQLRNLGLPIADLDLEAPLNELIYGKNAGKPLTAVYNELTSMAQKGILKPEEAKQAIADLKRGNWTPNALRALDVVERDNAPSRVLNFLGFQNLILNKPREQLNKELGNIYDKAKGDKEATRKAFAENQGLSVKFSSYDNPEEIEQNLRNDATRKAVSDLFAQKKSGQITQKSFNERLTQLEATNPKYFDKYPLDKTNNKYYEQKEEYARIGGDKYDQLSEQARMLSAGGNKKGASDIYNSKEYKTAQAAREQYLKDNPDFAKRYEAERIKYGSKPSPSEADKSYNDKLSEFYSIGGDRWEQLNAQYQKLRSEGKSREANAIYNSKDYQAIKNYRELWLQQNPEFADRYKSEQEKKYGTKPQQEKPLVQNLSTAITRTGGGGSVRTASGGGVRTASGGGAGRAFSPRPSSRTYGGRTPPTAIRTTRPTAPIGAQILDPFRLPTSNRNGRVLPDRLPSSYRSGNRIPATAISNVTKDVMDKLKSSANRRRRFTRKTRPKY